MSTFVAASLHPSSTTDARFADAVDACLRLRRQPLADRVGTGGLRAATFRRLTGGAPATAHDPRTGAFLVLAGTWLADGDLPPERLLEVFLERGPHALANRLEGPWIAIAGDPRQGSLTVITDPVGSQMGFLLQNRDGAFVSSSSLSLAALDDAGSLDPVSCQELLRLGSIYEDRTLHTRVKRLQQGSIYRFQDGALRDRQVWWSPAPFCTGSLSGGDAFDAFGEAIESVLRRASRVAPRLSCDVTGGYDSRTVFAAALSAGVEVEPTVTGPKSLPDVRVAQAIAAATGRRLRHIPPGTPTTLESVQDAMVLTDGEYDAVEYGQILAVHSQLARDRDMSLNGSAGEIGRGKQFPFGMPRLWSKSSEFVTGIAALKYGDDESTGGLFVREQRLDLRHHFDRVFRAELAGHDELPVYARLDLVYLLRMRYWQARIASSTQQVWPNLAPFLTRTVLETMLSMSVSARLNSRLFRRYLWRRQRRLARVPLADGYAPAPLRPDTLPLLAPVAAYYAGRVTQKLSRIVRGEGAAGSAGGPTPPQRAARQLLLVSADVRDVLDARTMRSARLFEPEALGRFLAAAENPGFPYDAQWRRLLSLECALRAVAEARAKRLRPREDVAPETRQTTSPHSPA